MGRRRKSLPQHIVSVLTPRLPGPLKSIVTSRLGAPLTLLVAGTLIATGVLQFNWQEGIPHLTVDEQRAAELQEDVAQYVDSVQENIQDARNSQGSPRWLPRAADGFTPPTAEPTPWHDWRPQESYAPQPRYGTPPPSQPYVDPYAYPPGPAPQPSPNMADRWRQQR